MKVSRWIKSQWGLVCLLAAGTCGLAQAEPGQISLSFGGVGAVASSQIPLSAAQGVGLNAMADYRFSNFFSLGLNTGMVEFLANPGKKQDMKTIWLDLQGRFFPLPRSPLGEAYFQLGFGVSPHLSLFPDYFPNYTTNGKKEEFYKSSPGTIYWDAQAALGYLFTLGPAWALDMGIEYDYFWPPAQTPLETIGLRAGVVWSFGA